METQNFDSVRFILVFIKSEVYDSRSSVYCCEVFMARSDVVFFIQYFKFSVAFFIGNLVDLSVWHPFCW